MQTVISKSAAVLFALTLGCGMAYGAMGEKCGNGTPPPSQKSEMNMANPKSDHCGSAKCGEAKALFQKQHCASGKSSEGKPESGVKCGKGKCGS